MTLCFHMCCALLSNQYTKPTLKILDAPGFASSKTLSAGYNTYKANLGILREILYAQSTEKLVFKRILYFLPGREPLERADSTLQEELSVMYYFFGNLIFQNMVLVVTLHRKFSHKNALTAEDLREGCENFQVALASVIRASLREEQAAPETPTPPMIYLSLEDTGDELFSKLMAQPVKYANGLHLTFVEEVCVRCATKLVMVEGKKAYALDDEGKPFVYDETSCHPTFVRKYGKTERVLGGITIIILLGIAKAFGVPWFTNSEEVCLNKNCRKPPGSPGCMKVSTKYDFK